ncbi:tRNA1(Val) (adenine(37)-N6)-methyltransferase [Candidatus Electronema sp. JM]|uniref:tRNA1(Val) (adenine(37)-N6)-methyltransferase n=1 Tax=Candidatus Electronema sp. JM TaxID=3401571 RepID=UPI003AA84A13
MLLSEDTLFNGRLICRQHREGYRFSVDAVLLAHFCQPARQDSVLDLGCGCGVIGLILCHRHPELRLTGLEVQPALAALAQSNAEANQLGHRFAVRQGDLRQISDHVQAESFDLVVSNPPYYRAGSGRISHEDERAVARHELRADPDSVLAAAAFAVRNRGAVCCIYPAERLAAVLAAMLRSRLMPKRLLPVHSCPEDQQARLVLIEAMKNGGEGLRLLPPLFLQQRRNGPDSPELERMYRDDVCASSMSCVTALR